MKQRSFICLLAAIVLVVYAFDYLPIHEEGIGQMFAYSWLAFAALVIAGNGVAVLGGYRQKAQKDRQQENAEPEKRREFG
ncbi:hypothetical protein CAY60_009655 [Shouchella clausii]|uniref:Uncharacterized protein n=3 Tax=Shouchella TaxID=2893057 RepID=Q5WEE5_SHOC1|nr:MULTISPECIES: hypothetical protein [Shouchella]MCM3313463.1 hypothetical protein [Psychrobacillus sp. MER TA 17]ALA54348.1 hypothetical protein DB29_03520 [Shouchella clausii]KKI86486.1 hypothetical protein WZ76_10875 [Shouchella clausii]MBU3232541.1 hypothetical protein [Shouchella clausii]MBU3265919.1 hypothetical protein [Shouchella clausii]